MENNIWSQFRLMYMAKLEFRLFSTDETISSGWNTLGIMFGILGCALISFGLSASIYAENELLALIFFGLGGIIILPGLFGLTTKLLADGLSAGLGLHDRQITGLRTRRKVVSFNQTLKIGFSVLRVAAGTVFWSIFAFAMGTYFESSSESSIFFDIQTELAYTSYAVCILIIVSGCLGMFTKAIADSVSIGLSLHHSSPRPSATDTRSSKESGKKSNFRFEYDPSQEAAVRRSAVTQAILCPGCGVNLGIPDTRPIKVTCPQCLKETMFDA